MEYNVFVYNLSSQKGKIINLILHCDLCAQELELHKRSINYYKDL
jgi:hypothetical protein